MPCYTFMSGRGSGFGNPLGRTRPPNEAVRHGPETGGFPRNDGARRQDRRPRRRRARPARARNGWRTIHTGKPARLTVRAGYGRQWLRAAF